MDGMSADPFTPPKRTHFHFLPPESPLAMPQQALRGRDAPPTHDAAVPKAAESARRATAERFLSLHRAFIFFATAATTAAAGYEMYQVLRVGGLTELEAAVLVLFVVLFAWVAFSFMSALPGFILLMLRRDRSLDIDPDGPLPNISSRSALLLPIYNEDPRRVMSRLQAIHESIEQTGRLAHFDFFVLSDTTDPDIWIAEEAAYLDLLARTGSRQIFYRHRYRNVGRKAGNIAEWLRRFGGHYAHMIVLDADSLMTGDTVVRLIGAMERHPQIALIQTLPIIVNAATPFARLQQFAGRLYGPLIARGIAWWHGPEGNYWGHNAAIRIAAFAAHAGLPELSGRKPFGGHILSHDFVEAALMRRAGWGIHMAPTLSGSYEEVPPSLTDYIARDRRWCQGNLQHLGVLTARGLHWVSRLHLLTGIGTYVTAPLWFVFLIFGMLISLQAQFVRPEYFPHGFSLFPHWPAQDPVRAAQVFAATMGILIFPKLLAYASMLARPAERRGFGGAIRAFFGVLMEVVISGLIAPVMMISQTRAVLDVLLGRDAGWHVQRRDDGSVPFSVLVRRFAPHTMLGLLLAAGAYAVSVPLFYWMSPVIVGLLLAVPLAAITSASQPGAATRRLFLTPEEFDAPKIVTRANKLYAGWSKPKSRDAITWLRRDSALSDAHLAMLPPPRRRRGDIDVDLVVAKAKLEDSETISDVSNFLTRKEKAALLTDAHALEKLLALPDNTG
jgi:membrane glycosyltransferase